MKTIIHKNTFKFFATILVVSITLCACKNSGIKRVNAPIFKTDKRTIDIGVINKNTTPEISRTFRISNQGNAPLIIKRVSPSCDCVTVRTHFPDTLQPSEEKQIRIEINLTEERGLFEKKLFIRSNDTGEVDIIHIKGTIE